MLAMGDLDNSPLFDRRHLDFLSRLLYGVEMRPISGVEQKFSRQKLLLQEIDSAYEGRLLPRLEAYKNYVAVQVAIEFLTEALRYGMLEEAREVLEATVEEKRGGDINDLRKILEESKTIPAEWAVIVYGEGLKDRHERTHYSMPSGLNLEAMEKFH